MNCAAAGAGMTLQGGVSTGRRDLDNCDVIDDLPEAAVLTAPYCHQKENFLTDGKLVWTYTIPKVDVHGERPVLQPSRVRSSPRTR